MKVLSIIMVVLTMSGCVTVSSTQPGKYSEWWMTDENQHLVTQNQQSLSVGVVGIASFGSMQPHQGGHRGKR